MACIVLLHIFVLIKQNYMLKYVYNLQNSTKIKGAKLKFLFLFSIYFFSFLGDKAWGQGGNNEIPQSNSNLLQFKEMNIRIPTSPDVTAMKKFGNIKVDFFNGLPDISFPLYEINVGNIKIPIVLSYHASGIKVSEYASSVGLGWALFAGGFINKNIKGNEDNGETVIPFAPTKRYDYNVSKNIEHINYLYDYTRSIAGINNYFDKNDLDPDIFDYRLPNDGGKFIYFNDNYVLQIPLQKKIIKKNNKKK